MRILLILLSLVLQWNISGNSVNIPQENRVQKTLNVENSAADFDCPFRFCGMYEDAETGLCYNRHRYYDPSMGCYLSQDPIGLNGGAALYAYVHDPNSWIDPLGLLSAKELAAAQKMGANAETIAQKRYGFTKNTATVPSIEAGRYHIPDGMTDTTIFEVKCVGKQGYTRQIKSYVEKGRRDVVLIVDTDTKLSKPLQQMVDDGVIQLERTDLKNRTNAKTGCG